MVAVLNWIKIFRNKRIILFCDNESVVYMINASSSKCKNCMMLIRTITVESLVRNVRVFAKHLGTKDNGRADALSRMDFPRFWKLSEGKNVHGSPTGIPQEIRPMDKLWIY